MSKSSNSPKKILLADDSVTMHRAVKLGLKKEPFDVTCVDNGADAWRIVKDSMPDAVLADLDMPGMTGGELCQKIKADPALKHIPVILVCGSFDQVDEKHLESIPADARLWKPFETHVLVSLLAKVLGNGGGVREAAEPTNMRVANEATAAIPSPTQGVRPPPPPHATASKTQSTQRVPPPPPRMPVEPTAQFASEATQQNAFEPTSSQHLSEPGVESTQQQRREEMQVPGVNDASESLFEGFQDIPLTDSDSVVHTIEATELGFSGAGEATSHPQGGGESYENLWASDLAETSAPTINQPLPTASVSVERTEMMPTSPNEATEQIIGDASWANFDDSEKSFSNEVFEAVETRNFEDDLVQDRQAAEATEMLNTQMLQRQSVDREVLGGVRDSSEATRPLTTPTDLQGFREETSQSYPPGFPASATTTQLPPRPAAPKSATSSGQRSPSLVDHSSAAAATAIQQSPGISEEEIRKIIREEIQTAITGWLKNRLHDELDRVIEEIDRE